MQATWANFAKDPMKGPGWPAYGAPGGLDVAVIGGTNPGNPDAAAMFKGEDLDRRCRIFEQAMGMDGIPPMAAGGGVIGRKPVLGA